MRKILRAALWGNLLLLSTGGALLLVMAASGENIVWGTVFKIIGFIYGIIICTIGAVIGMANLIEQK